MVAVVSLVAPVIAVMPSHINFTAEDGLEFLIFAAFLVQFADIIMEFLDSVHVAMVGNCHATHAVGYRFINQCLDGRHAVKNRIL